jgi:DNA-binding response OmpR family regulator
MSKQKTILIVEDEEKAAGILQPYLTQEGYKTLVAHNGRDALALIKGGVSLVILDLMLPDISGGNDLSNHPQTIPNSCHHTYRQSRG